MLSRARLRPGERTFVRNLLVFMTGRSIATALTFLLTPVISRLYLPSHFGAAAILLSVMTVLVPVSCGSYDKAVTVARSTDDARDLLRLCTMLAIVTAVVAPALIAALASVGLMMPALMALGPLLWLLPAAIVIDGITTGAAAWILRHRQYKALAVSEVVQQGTRSGLRIGAGLAFGSTIGALVWSYVLALAAKLYTVVVGISRVAPAGGIFPTVRQLARLRDVARQYSDFPRYNMLTGLMMQLTTQLPVFVLGSAFSAQVVGFFAMADRLMRTPINIASNTLRQVALQKLSETWNAGRPIRGQLARVVAGLILLAIVPFLVFYTFGEELFALVLGDRWRTAGRYIEILAPYFVVAFIGAPFQASTAAMRRQRLWFWLEMCTAAGRLIIIPVAALSGATPELVLRVYVWTTVTTKMMAFVVVFLQTPARHPGFDAA